LVIKLFTITGLAGNFKKVLKNPDTKTGGKRKE
jgi:hypothetical protein